MIHTMFALCIPSINLPLTAVSHWLYPFTRTKGVICSPELFTRRKLLATSLNASTHTINPIIKTPVGHTWSNLHSSASNVWSTISFANVEWWLDFGSGICHIGLASGVGRGCGLAIGGLPGVESGCAPSEFTPFEILAIVRHCVVLELMMDWMSGDGSDVDGRQNDGANHYETDLG